MSERALQELGTAQADQFQGGYQLGQCLRHPDFRTRLAAQCRAHLLLGRQVVGDARMGDASEQLP